MPDRLYQTLFNALEDAVAVISVEGRFLEINDYACRRFGYSREELLQLGPADLDVPEMRERIKGFLTDILAGEKVAFETQHVCRNGSIYPAEIHASCIDFHGQLAILAISRDISERKRLESESRQSAALFRQLVQNASDILVLLDAHGVQRFISPAVERITGYTPQELLVPINEICHPDDIPLLMETWMRGLTAPGKAIRLEFRHRHKHGGYVELETIGVNLLNDPDVQAVVCSTRDVSQRKQAEAALAEAKLAAEAASRAKSEFLANMSHEIRTPLNGVIGMIHLLRLDNLTDTQREYLEVMEYSAQNLLGVINDILDLSQIEAGHMELHPKEFSLRQIVSEAVQIYLPRIREKRLEISAKIPSQLPDLVVGDSQRLRQILLNLISNAVKFTERGEIRIEVSSPSTQDGICLYRIDVSDTGIGMSEETLARLFQPFVQGDASLTRNHGGSGLGLAISRRLAGLMGGTIEVESQAGAGSCFRVVLPLTTLPAAEEWPPRVDRAPVPLPGSEHPVRILLAEDNAINALYVTELLTELGHLVTSVRNGFDVIAAWEKDVYDLILMDVQMPGMDGLTAMRTIRQREGRDRHMPIVALTAYALRNEQEELLKAGFDAYVAKPFAPEDLIPVLQSFSPAGEEKNA